VNLALSRQLLAFSQAAFLNLSSRLEPLHAVCHPDWHILLVVIPTEAKRSGGTWLNANGLG
jgi:hypothetical protein